MDKEVLQAEILPVESIWAPLSAWYGNITGVRFSFCPVQITVDRGVQYMVVIFQI